MMTVTVAEHCGGNSGRGNICVWLVVFGALVHVSCINKGKLGLNTCFSSAIGYRKTEKKKSEKLSMDWVVCGCGIVVGTESRIPASPIRLELIFWGAVYRASTTVAP